MANLLLAHGASPDQAGKNGMTPLHIAAQYDQQQVATTLLEKGADAKVNVSLKSIQRYHQFIIRTESPLRHASLICVYELSYVF